MKIRILSIIMGLALAINAWGADFEIDGIFYRQVSSEMCIVVWGNKPYEGDIVIPPVVRHKNKYLVVAEIAEKAFSSCRGLRSVVLPASVTVIGREAFSQSGLSSITLPESVLKIRAGAFAGSNLKAVALPSSIIELGGGQFSGCKRLELASLPASLKHIDSYMFNECERLKSIEIPGSVTSLGDYAFAGCEHLRTIAIPQSVTKIGVNAFAGCTRLDSISIPGSVTELGVEALKGCSKLSQLNFAPSDHALRIITGWQAPSSYAITQGCKALTTLCLGRRVEYEMEHAIHGDSIKHVVLSLNELDDALLDLPEVVSHITFTHKATHITNLGDIAGNDLTTIECEAATPPACDVSFTDKIYHNCTLRVPVGATTAYQAVAPWNKFQHIVEQ